MSFFLTMYVRFTLKKKPTQKKKKRGSIKVDDHHNGNRR